MPSPGKPDSRPSAESFALALLIASSLQIMENLLPRLPLFPWMRIGISYVIILPFMLRYGARAGFALLLARNGITLLYGQPLTTFLIGSGAGAAAFLTLGGPVAALCRRGILGLAGACVAMSAAFNLAQLALVNLAFIRHAGFYFQIGPLLGWSLISGLMIALLIRFSSRELDLVLATSSDTPVARPVSVPDGPRDWKPFLAGLVLLIALFATPWFAAQLPVFACMLLIRDRFRHLIRAWPFFFYLAWLHLFQGEGEFWLGEWVTREGASTFALYSLRLANFILLGRWLTAHLPWDWARDSASPYLRGFLLTLPLLSDLFAPSMEMGRQVIRDWRKGKRGGILAAAFATWRERMDAAGRNAAGKAG